MALAFAVALALLFGFAAAKVWQVRRRPPQTGQEELVGQVGLVRQCARPGGLRPRPRRALAGAGEDGPDPAGEPVEVTGLDDGLVLDVSPAAQPASVDA